MLKLWLYSTKLWHLRKTDETYLQDLLESRGNDDRVDMAMANRVLLEMRLRRALEPYRELKRYFRIFNWVWRKLHGGYRKSSSQVHGNPNTTSGGGSGTGGIPTAQFTFNAAGFAATTSPGAGGVVGGLTNSGFEDAGIVAGEVTAFRCWQLNPDGFLYSTYRSDFRWKPGEVIEGDAEAGYGVHAFKSLLLMAEYGTGRSDRPIVTGTVQLWGDVYEHERGYRASRAAIKTIDDGLGYDAKALRKLYGLNRRKKKA